MSRKKPGGIQGLIPWIKTQLMPRLLWTEALRALLCMLPMIVAAILGQVDYLVPLGQGGFFFSTLFLPKKFGSRFVMGSLVLALGLGFYMIGGAVAPNPVTATIFTFLVCLNLSFLTSWKIGGPLALTFVMIYTAGLNTGSPERASANFYLFAIALGWAALVSLLPIWKATKVPPHSTEDIPELTLQGTKMGIGASIALALSYMFDFAKLGWAPSAVGNIVRYEPGTSRKRAWARFYGTIGGALLAAIALAFLNSVTAIVIIGTFFGILNGLFKNTKIGMMPLFYTATILLLYSANALGEDTSLILQRVGYNLIGITIGMLVVIYPFRSITKKLEGYKTT